MLVSGARFSSDARPRGSASACTSWARAAMRTINLHATNNQTLVRRPGADENESGRYVTCGTSLAAIARSDGRARCSSQLSHGNTDFDS
jgi:hypothetical protein